MALPTDEDILILQLRDARTRREVFSELVKTYSKPLYWHIRRMVLSHDDANDLLQNTFIKAWTGIDGFLGNAKVSSWLYRIATNETLTFLNKNSHNASIEEAEAVTSQLEADEYFDGDNLQTRLQAAIQTLPPKQRMIFNMKYFEEMKYEEISNILGTSVGALKASYHLAVKKVYRFSDKRFGLCRKTIVRSFQIVLPCLSTDYMERFVHRVLPLHFSLSGELECAC